MSIVKDGMYGFVIGDALGVPVEFKSRESLSRNPVTEMIGYGSYFDLPEGVWSDDTSLTLATMDSITKCHGINYQNMAECFCDWMNHGKYTATGIVFDIGITTKYALARFYEDGIEACKCGGISISENGNGSLMRMLPIVFYCFDKKLDDSKILEIVKNTSSITHAHEQSIMGCFIYVKYLLYLLNGYNKQEAYELIKKLDYNVFSIETQKVYSRILSEDISQKKIDEIISSGYVVHTLEASLWLTLNYNSYDETVLTAVNLGEDTDTVAAVTGSIAGILYGFDNINKSWIEKLKNKELLDSIIKNYEQKL